MANATQNDSLSIATIIILITVILLSMMEVLDMTVVNVALPVMMGNLHVSVNNISWIITAYIIASAIIMPITGALVKNFGCRKILLISIAGFAIASGLCGITNNFWLIVLFRLAQGLCGASLVPLSQYIIIHSVSKKIYATAVAIWGAGITIAPILGPTIGGLVIKYFGWPFLFFINLPISIIAFVLILVFLNKDETLNNHSALDYFGFILLGTAIGCGLFVLNRGDELGWFSSKFVVYLLAITIISGSTFIIRGLNIREKNIIDFALFNNRKFLLSTLIVTMISGIIMGMGAIMPIFLENFLNYSPEIVGLINIPNGITTIIAMGLATLLLKFFDARWIMFVGIIISSYGTFLLSKITLNIDQHYIIYLYCMRAFGFGLCFIPILATAFMNLNEKFTALGSGVFNFARNIGSSIGITLASSNLNNLMQTHWSHLSANISPYSLNYQLWLHEQSVTPSITYNNPIAIALTTSEVAKNSYLLAFNDLFFLFAISFLVCVPLILILGKTRVNKLTLAG
jgi:DHA2 family multidrug resistance protein